MTLSDSDHRLQATDPSASFIVQAPAGSGKTEILTQRYLRLLSRVTAPEQIVALTFTKKAAAEMRERIVLALERAAQKQEAQNTHQQLTLGYAQQALTRCQHLRWDLLKQPNRLKVMTIDALCSSITQAIPLLEKQNAYATISDKPQSLYLLAAKRCIQFALETPDYQQAIQILLLHGDNRQDRLSTLFVSLLAQRDQWISLLFTARNQEKARCEEALRLIEQHEVQQLIASLPQELSMRLVQLARSVAAIENNKDSERYLLSTWDDFSHLNAAMAFALSKLVLTGTKELRKRFDHHVGLKKEYCSPEEFTELKAQSIELLNDLSHYPEFLNLLIEVSQVPKTEYPAEQWEVLQALFQLVPLLLGHLHLLFAERNEVDFTSVAQQALDALGAPEDPTQLALYLDHSIHHLLVDEFQDTSMNQFELLSQLVQEWREEEGKTLFIVGDPMQSIYRFRQAEVGLFFRAQQYGIGPIKLHSLTLRANFRSAPTLIQWVNQHCASFFPKNLDIAFGAVPFYPAQAVLEEKPASGVFALEFIDREEEAKNLIHLIREELKRDPEQKLAVLVRSRTHLPQLIKYLRQHQIPYQGADIDLLSNLPHMRDLWSLTQALLAPADRLAWLALLRSPFCGLSLADLLSIAQFNKKQSVYFALLALDNISLSPEGRIRAAFFRDQMHNALTKRQQGPLSQWVATTLQTLHGDKLLTRQQWADLEQFWNLLDSYEEKGLLLNKTDFLNELNTLYAQQAKPAALQVMTIHKSKGLEFDTVFLPSIGARPNKGASPLLRWLQLPAEDKSTLLLFSPIQAAHQTHCPLYDYLGRLDEKKAHYETQRLLYVAVTRAKTRLYLLDTSPKPATLSFRALLTEQSMQLVAKLESTQNNQNPLPKVQTLPLSYYQKDSSLKTEAAALSYSMAQIADQKPKAIGVVSHQLLQWIGTHHPKAQQIPWNLAYKAFKKLGYDQSTCEALTAVVKENISKMVQDPIGAWILAAHSKERNEYELLVQQKDNYHTRIIDRCFEEADKLWIIDFKTGQEKDAASPVHQQQVNDYAYHLSSTTVLTIHCGLYYLSNRHWIHWIYTPQEVEYENRRTN